MATLPTQSFSVIVANTIAGIQGRASALINFSEGSTLRALVEGFGGIYLWFQALIVQLLSAMRLSTAQGTDVDTFTADFMPVIPGSQTAALPNGSPRLGAQASSGQVTFARFTAGPTSCFIPVGTTAQSNDGSQSFTVIADPAYATYSAGLNGYTLPSNIGSIVVPVQAVTAGAGGNVAAGAISVITSPVTGIDTVTNVAAFTNGANQESDSALKSRFAAYILGLSRGDYFGLAASIEGAEVNVQWSLTEDYDLSGAFHPGFFFVVADDGSGAPSQTFLNAIVTAAQAVRPLSIQCAVFPPTIVFATPSLQIATAAGYDHATVVSQVSAVIANNINSLGLGNSLNYTQIAAWAYSVAGVTAVTGVLLNGIAGDSATLNAYTLTQDGKVQMLTSTIKTRTVIVS
jgi:phage-related baseplate assembly protein